MFLKANDYFLTWSVCGLIEFQFFSSYHIWISVTKQTFFRPQKIKLCCKVETLIKYSTIYLLVYKVERTRFFCPTVSHISRFRWQVWFVGDRSAFLWRTPCPRHVMYLSNCLGPLPKRLSPTSKLSPNSRHQYQYYCGKIRPLRTSRISPMNLTEVYQTPCMNLFLVLCGIIPVIEN